VSNHMGRRAEARWVHAPDGAPASAQTHHPTPLANERSEAAVAGVRTPPKLLLLCSDDVTANACPLLLPTSLHLQLWGMQPLQCCCPCCC
jgi:hypothetical protein